MSWICWTCNITWKKWNWLQERFAGDKTKAIQEGRNEKRNNKKNQLIRNDS